MVADNPNCLPPPWTAKQKEQWTNAQLHAARMRREAATRMSAKFRDAGFFLLGVAACLLYVLFVT